MCPLVTSSHPVVSQRPPPPYNTNICIWGSGSQYLKFERSKSQNIAGQKKGKREEGTQARRTGSGRSAVTPWSDMAFAPGLGAPTPTGGGRPSGWSSQSPLWCPHTPLGPSAHSPLFPPRKAACDFIGTEVGPFGNNTLPPVPICINPRGFRVNSIFGATNPNSSFLLKCLSDSR